MANYPLLVVNPFNIQSYQHRSTMSYRKINPTKNAPTIPTPPLTSPNPLPALEDLVVVVVAAVTEDTDVGSVVVACEVLPEPAVGVGVPVLVARLGFGVVATAPYKHRNQTLTTILIRRQKTQQINLPSYYSSQCPYKPSRYYSRARTKDHSTPDWDNRRRTTARRRADSIVRSCRRGNRAIALLRSRMPSRRFAGRRRLCLLFLDPGGRKEGVRYRYVNGSRWFKGKKRIRLTFGQHELLGPVQYAAMGVSSVLLGLAVKLGKLRATYIHQHSTADPARDRNSLRCCTAHCPPRNIRSRSFPWYSSRRR